LQKSTCRGAARQKVALDNELAGEYSAGMTEEQFEMESNSDLLWWELWDTDSGNMIGDYLSLAEAIERMVEIGQHLGNEHDDHLVLSLGGVMIDHHHSAGDVHQAATLSLADLRRMAPCRHRSEPDEW